MNRRVACRRRPTGNLHQESTPPALFVSTARPMLGNTLIEQNKLSNYLSVFGLSACDILGRHSTRAQMSEFGGISKTLTISRLNFIDTCLNPKTGLNKPERSRKRAAVASQLRPFPLPTVALSQTLRARRGKPTDFSGSLKPVFHSRWSISADVFLLIFFATIRHLSKPHLIGFSQAKHDNKPRAPAKSSGKTCRDKIKTVYLQ